ncbi:hypothetical protein BKA67DRAFT_695339 [Truncatella angustata]|uniref:BZIP domain-containing protein n=1 Tax=Truncatella angustata TaxID=152316 RepID=A0A9P8UCK8_9PEZI|nr:uncharacterized protein BKA67DRAFT_695339 [Truncatella angustata]KAH6646821.1 hypothetical protein BKA67DRAFT_695339 [Truncatella angustata]
MKSWPTSSLAIQHGDLNHLQAMITAKDSAEDYPECYGMGDPPSGNLCSMQGLLTPTVFFNDMVQLEQIGSSLEWEIDSNSLVLVIDNIFGEHASFRYHNNCIVCEGRTKESAQYFKVCIVELRDKPSRQLSKEKNRIAASKCRRKKVAEHQLEEEWGILKAQNNILKAFTGQLQDEVLYLKDEVLKHGTCDFLPIQSYIKQAATSSRLIANENDTPSQPVSIKSGQ